MISPSLGTRFRPRICFITYRHIAELADPIIAEYANRADIEVAEGAFEDALSIARERIRAGSVDVFVSSGANGAILRKHFETPPVAIIQLSGFDLMKTLLKAREKSTRVGIVMYGRTILELDQIKEILKLDIAQYSYETPSDARLCFKKLREDGFGVIVGSSIVVEMAEEQGLVGLLGYSSNSVRQGFDDAIELARVTRLELGRYQQLNGVLGNLQEAVLAVDRSHRVIAINPMMAELLGKNDESLLGRPLDTIEPELSLLDTMESGAESHAMVLHLAGRDWAVNRTPIREYGEIVGAAITLYDAQLITEADTSLRMQQRRRQAARYSFNNMIGNSACFHRAINSARRFAQTDLTVLITGESGSGKELFAQAIHNESTRSKHPFIALNCASFPEPLLESELFGYEDGAFTGSRRGGKHGLFEAAHKGSLFLDEIGDMPLSLQTRLLRVLQEREITRLGGVSTIPIDVRIIAATHQPLQDLVARHTFRQDLYYRINTLCLPLPSLRDRPGDIVVLAQTLMTRSLRKLGSKLDAESVLAPLLPYLVSHSWPGNVRELENITDRISVYLLQFGNQHEVAYDGLRAECPELFLPENPGADGSAERHTKARLIGELKANMGNRGVTAQKLGISRSTLWRWMKEIDAGNRYGRGQD